MSTKSQLILPPQPLASCIAAGIVRDTRGVPLTDHERLNYFPAAPLFTATLTLEGQIYLGDGIASLDTLRHGTVADRLLFQTPRTEPHVSWNPGPILALTVAFFPDAWLRLGGTLQGTPPPSILPAFKLLEHAPLDKAWPAFWTAMEVVWTASTTAPHLTEWAGSNRIKDWAYHMLGKVSRSNANGSLRSAQRRLQRWTGQNRKSLEFFAKVDELHRLHVKNPEVTPAELAIDAGFADQSHMGRTLKRATGFSPMALNAKIETDETFWCYRLLGQRF